MLPVVAGAVVVEGEPNRPVEGAAAVWPRPPKILGLAVD